MGAERVDYSSDNEFLQAQARKSKKSIADKKMLITTH